MEPSYVLTDGLVKALDEAFATADIAALLRLHDELDKNVEGRPAPKAPQDFSEAINDAIYANSSDISPGEFEAIFDTLCRTQGLTLTKAPQDMDLRELFDHVAIVNDAIRAALLTHPGMTPMRQEPTPRQCASCGGYSHASFKKCVNCSAVLG